MTSHLPSLLGGHSSNHHGLMSGSSTTLAAASASDSRLLTNLIKSEKTYVGHLSSSVNSAHNASTALTAWGTSEAPDIADASARISQLLSAAADVQHTHLSAIEGYRSALKDVADREASIRNVVRDRDILVGRLIKASKSSKKSPEERAERVALAQRELQACEEVLATEQAALVGVKRRTFKEALSMRMKTMGDAGAAMVDAAREAILLLNDFDANGVPSPTFAGPHGHRRVDSTDTYDNQEEHEDGRGYQNAPGASLDTSSVTPSQSASQVYQRPAGYNPPFPDGGIGEEPGEGGNDSDSEVGRQWRESMPAPHHLDPDSGIRGFVPTIHRDVSSKTPSPAPTPPRKDTQRAPERSGGYSVPMPPVPSAPRLTDDGTNLMPVPTAPRPVMAGDDSSSEEDTRPTIAHRNVAPPPRRSARAYDDDASSDEGATARQSSSRPAAKRNSSFLGRVGRLFKTDVREAPPMPDRAQESLNRRSTGWHTRTDDNLRTSSAMSVREPGAQLSKRASLLRPMPGSKAAERQAATDDSSDEEEPRDLVKHVNPRRPLWQGEKASSDVGGPGLKESLNPMKRMSLKRTPSVNAGPLSWKAQQAQEEEERMRAARASVIGAGVGGGNAAAGASSGSTIGPNGTIKQKKKKSRPPSVTGSEIGTGPTRSSTYGGILAARPTSVVVAGDASTGIRRSESLRTAPTSLSRNNSMTGSTRSKTKKKRGSILPGHELNAMSPHDGNGKFSTSTWVSRPGNAAIGVSGGMTAADAVANAGVVSSGPSVRSTVPLPTSSTTTSVTTTSKTTPVAMTVPKAPPPASAVASAPVLAAPTARRPEPPSPTVEHGTHVPQPSRTQSPPPKSALKAPSLSGLSRNGASSSSAPFVAPVIPPPMSAPPPVSSLRQEATLNAASRAADAPPQIPELSSSSNNKGKAPALSLGEDQSFDGTGSLGDVNLNGDAASKAGNGAAKSGGDLSQQKKSSLPRIDMPPSEPFRVDLDEQGKPRRGSIAITPTDKNEPALMTPGEAAALSSYLDTETQPQQTYVKAPASTTSQSTQPPGVTRVTVASTKIRPSRTYGPGVVDSSDSSDAGAGGAESEVTPAATRASASAPAPLTSSLAAPKPALSIARSDTSAEGSGVSRRKSVRLAPDVKVPPESPTPRAERPDPMSRMTLPRAPGSSLPGTIGPIPTAPPSSISRIAPPPPAPAKVSGKGERPIDIGGREASGWSTRIGQQDDSSSEDGEGLDSYASARRAFGSASRHWGKATGAIKPKTKKASSDVGAAEPSASPSRKKSTKGKKKGDAAAENFGYNPAVPLPASMAVVGRSFSTKRS